MRNLKEDCADVYTAAERRWVTRRRRQYLGSQDFSPQVSERQSSNVR
jgi:hypothetical protein